MKTQRKQFLPLHCWSLLNEGSPKQLDDLYKSTRTLIQGCLGEDLGQAVLADSERWNKIRDHVVVHQITDVILKY